MTAATVTHLVAINGGKQPFSPMNPYLTLDFCITCEGIYPSRN